jgi:hypothetical protein
MFLLVLPLDTHPPHSHTISFALVELFLQITDMAELLQHNRIWFLSMNIVCCMLSNEQFTCHTAYACAQTQINNLLGESEDLREFSVKSSCLHPVFGPPFTP